MRATIGYTFTEKPPKQIKIRDASEEVSFFAIPIKSATHTRVQLIKKRSIAELADDDPNPSVFCPHCGAAFMSKFALKIHFEISHKGEV